MLSWTQPPVRERAWPLLRPCTAFSAGKLCRITHVAADLVRPAGMSTETITVRLSAALTSGDCASTGGPKSPTDQNCHLTEIAIPWQVLSVDHGMANSLR